MPKREHADDAGEQKRGAAGIADAKRAISEIGHGRARGRRSDDGRPIKKSMKFLGHDLKADEHDEARQKERRPQEIAPMQRHGDGIAARFAQCRCKNFDDPEAERDFRDFAKHFFAW